MFKIQTLNAISDIIYTQLSPDQYTVTKDEPVPDGILVRSAAMHDMELGENLLGIARAGAGVNNIPIDKCSRQGICVFNTPGANANAVAELVLCGLLLGSRNVFGGMMWAQSRGARQNPGRDRPGRHRPSGGQCGQRRPGYARHRP